MIADQKGYGDHSTSQSNNGKATWLDFGTNDGKEWGDCWLKIKIN